MDDIKNIQRRHFIQQAAVISAILPFGPGTLLAADRKRITKAIPVSGEKIPVIGMGSARTFDVGEDPARRAQLADVLQAFFDHGGNVIDSSPMYGRAEQVIGELLRKTRNTNSLFAATKVWTDGKQQGIEQMHRSMQRMGVEKFDLMQIHNLRDWKVHLETLRDWKSKGNIRYIGITTSHGRFHEELETILSNEQFDFVQLSYNINDRAVEQRLLPLAKERKIAVLVNRPFQKGELFKAVSGETLPDWAMEFDCQSWGQFFLKFVVSHPSVTCAIPATTKVKHMLDNMGAGLGQLPDAKMRKKMISHIEKI